MQLHGAGRVNDMFSWHTTSDDLNVNQENHRLNRWFACES